jgi:hypothetical protein
VKLPDFANQLVTIPACFTLLNFECNMSATDDHNLGINVEIVWFDQDVVECQVRCSNGRFSGVAEIYLSHDDLPKMAAALKGFPNGPSDVRDLELGTFNPKHAGVRLRCYCRDSAGHAVMEVKLRGDASKGLGEPESVALLFPVEAAAIDSFLTQVRSMDTEQIGSAALLAMTN